jgi:hypothetical protein
VKNASLDDKSMEKWTTLSSMAAIAENPCFAPISIPLCQEDFGGDGKHEAKSG